MKKTLNTENPLLRPPIPPVADPMAISTANIKQPIPSKRQILDLRRAEFAANAAELLQQDGSSVYGLTRGQFSLVDLLQAILHRTGPAQLSISTWTAAGADVSTMAELLQSGQVTGCRWLVDVTFLRRCPALVAMIRERFGADSIRVTRNHAKFAVISNDEWQIALRTSMNLNLNPRLESFEMGHDPALAGFLQDALDDIWRSQPRSLQDGTHTQQTQWWRRHG